MEITAISQEEFEEVDGKRTHRRPLLETLKNLEVGDGIRTPCTWNHGHGGCRGTTYAHQTVRNQHKGKKVKTTCRDKELFVLRVE